MIQLYASNRGVPVMMYETNSTFRSIRPTPAEVPMFFLDTGSVD